MEIKDRIIPALDVSSLEEAKPLVEQLAPYVGPFKVGLQLLTSEGAPRVVKAIQDLGGKVFYDGKFKDIPNIVAGATRAVTLMGVDMFSLHCLGGAKMMLAANDALDSAWPQVSQASGMFNCPLILGVTILTSLDEAQLEELGILWPSSSDPQVSRVTVKDLVVFLAELAHDCCLDGVIASPKEITAIREAVSDPTFCIVTPGIRPKWSTKDDQARITTPADAILSGADYLVIGRPILKPPPEIGSPQEAAKRILDEISSHLEERSKR